MHTIPRYKLSFLFFVLSALIIPPASNINIVSRGNSRPRDSLRDLHQRETVSNDIAVNAVVLNKNGEVVTDLKKQNFAVFVDGVQREINNFTTPGAPLEASLVIEYRYWGHPADGKGFADLEAIPVELFTTAEMLVSKLLKSPQDEISVVAVEFRPQFLTNATNDSKLLGDAVNLFRKNRPALREVVLFDALKLVITGGTDDSPILPKSEVRSFNYRGLSQSIGTRRAIIAITSGLDTLSKTSYKEVRRILLDAAVPLHVICTLGTLQAKVAKWSNDKRLLTGLPTKKDLEEAEQRLNAITKESGGGHHHYINELDGPKIVNAIRTMVSGQYNLWINLDGVRDGKAHAIEVRIDTDGDGVFDHQKFVVQARQVYNASKNR